MSQGEFVLFRSKQECEKRVQFLIKQIEDWDYTTPLTVKLEPYKNPRSLSQNANVAHLVQRDRKRNGKERSQG